MLWAGVILASYFLGSLPFGLWIGRSLYGIDLREHGSKNTGATNAYRVLGRLPALLVFVCDTAKGMLGVYLGAVLIGGQPAEVLGGIAAICGHNWSIFLGFKGGRGVATSLGVIAVLAPKVTLIVFCRLGSRCFYNQICLPGLDPCGRLDAPADVAVW